jgi:hypothetical protein
MQITLDLPDDVFAKADALAKQQSRSLGSVFADLIRGVKSAPKEGPKSPPTVGQRFPVVEGRTVTQAEIDRLLEEDGLP